jgi:hypothetical protein
MNAASVTAVMLAVDLIAWTEHLLLDATLSRPNRRDCATGCSMSPPDSSPTLARHPTFLALAHELTAAFARRYPFPPAKPHPQSSEQRSHRQNSTPANPTRPPTEHPNQR